MVIVEDRCDLSRIGLILKSMILHASSWTGQWSLNSSKWCFHQLPEPFCNVYLSCYLDAAEITLSLDYCYSALVCHNLAAHAFQHASISDQNPANEANVMLSPTHDSLIGMTDMNCLLHCSSHDLIFCILVSKEDTCE